MRKLGFAACALSLGLFGASGGASQLREAPIPRVKGQSVTPSFEGWFRNPDGSCSISFGYLNRNYEEVLDIPVGPNNRIEPGPADQGQPTHFLPRRQTGVFTIPVRDCADVSGTTVTWTLVSAGQTISVPGKLRPEWEIDALQEATTKNKPPVLTFDPAAPGGQGPNGSRRTATAAVGAPLAIEVWVTDDGVVRTGTGRPALGLVWSLLRGPGDVVFSEIEPKIDGTGKSSTTVTFARPGEYVLRVVAWDNSGRPGNVMAGGFQCCWTNGYAAVSVK